MSVLLDARPVADSVIAAVTAEIATQVDATQVAYDRSQVPGTNHNPGAVPALFAQVDVERRFDESALRVGASSGTTAWRITIGGVGFTVREAAWVLTRATRALEDVWLTTSDNHEFNCRFETYRAPEHAEDGRYWGAVTFTAAT